MKQYIITYDGVFDLYEDASDYLIANEENLEGILDSIKHGFELDIPHNIRVFEISKEVTNEYNVKTKYDQKDYDTI